jgi:hypothetical protein
VSDPLRPLRLHDLVAQDSTRRSSSPYRGDQLEVGPDARAEARSKVLRVCTIQSPGNRVHTAQRGPHCFAGENFDHLTIQSTQQSH